MDVNSDAVLACPFCGGTDVHPTRGKPEPLGTPASLTCADCHAQGPWRLETGYKPSNATAAWNRRATPASDEAVGDAVDMALVAFYRDAEYDCDGHILNDRACMSAALSARTAAPAEQGVEAELVEAALVDSSDAWTDEDARKPWGCEIAFLRHLANDPAMGVEKGAMLRHCAKRIEATADAPLARSVDGLSGEEREALLLVETSSPEACGSKYEEAAGVVCAALRSRLAGAKVQDVSGEGSP